MNRILRSLFFWEGLSFAVAFLGSRAMGENAMLWYSGLSRSALTPPNIAFPIVWTILYALMGYSAFRVAKRTNLSALIPYMAQLSLNLTWSWVFFYYREPTAALVNIFLMILAIIWTVVVFRKYDKTAAALLIPYLLWGCIAFWLNFYVVLHN
ncbi:MAG: tryptophan-rich sensory protein [Synergistaceae bacterium]|nr:tryptophan-rich sensory protein [Synergistaceae bacterium]